MEIDDVAKELKAHELKDELREEKLTKHLYKEEPKMSDDNTAAIIAAMGNKGDSGMSGGLAGGAGLMGLIAGALLGGNGGLLGGNRNNNNNVDTCVTPALLASSLAQVTDTSQATTVLQSLGDIKASIPLAEGQVQLALAGSTSNIVGTIGQGLQVVMQGQAGINANVSNAIATALAAQGDLKVTVLAANQATALGIANLATAGLQNTYTLSTAIHDDGERTRSLIASINQDNLNRQLTLAETALLEQRNIGRTRDLEVNVTQTVNQAQAQSQAQQQQQQQLILLAQIASGFSSLQNAVATNSNLIVGNTGATTTGTQTASPVNVHA